MKNRSSRNESGPNFVCQNVFDEICKYLLYVHIQKLFKIFDGVIIES